MRLICTIEKTKSEMKRLIANRNESIVKQYKTYRFGVTRITF